MWSWIKTAGKVKTYSVWEFPWEVKDHKELSSYIWVNIGLIP